MKIDIEKSMPYLLKFYASAADLSCCLMITDTKIVWGEVLSSKLLARRWRDCNPSPSFVTESEEDEWREQILDLLTAAHSLGAIADLSFEVVQSKNADLAFELGHNEFKWRWETYIQGPKVSADVISKHLIMPLISASHLAFSSSDSVSELSEANLEKAVDKAGRAGRRTVDNHVKHAISRPRLATTMRRMSAVFNFLPDLPPIISKVEPPELHVPAIRPKSPLPTGAPSLSRSRRSVSPGPSTKASVARSPPRQFSQEPSRALAQAVDEDSATEEEEGDLQPARPQRTGRAARTSGSPRSPKRDSVVHSRQPSPGPVTLESAPLTVSEPISDTSPSPARPAKKSKRSRVSSSSEDDSEAERKRRLAQLKSGSSRGPKQPIKRGGKRF